MENYFNLDILSRIFDSYGIGDAPGMRVTSILR